MGLNNRERLTPMVIELVDLHTTLAGIHFQNPLILASGIMDEDAGSMTRIIENGASAVVTKSIGLTPRGGHKNPTFVELEHGILNAMGLPNPGIKAYITELEEMNNQSGIIIGSIFGSTENEFQKLATAMSSYVDAIELNLSCPHAEGYGLEIGQNSTYVKKITKTVAETVSIPIFVKLSAQVNDIVDIAQSAEKAGADAIVAINTLKAMSINIELQQPILGNKTGGYSGEAIKPIGIRAVYELHKHLSIPIIGVGGITTGEDVIEYMMAGATTVQIGTAVYSRGIDVFQKIKDEIKKWMQDQNIQQLEKIIGVAHQ